MKTTHRLEYILNLIKEYPETKYIITNQFLAGDLVHSYIDNEDDLAEVSFSFTGIPETNKLYGVYNKPIEKIIIVFDANYKYPYHKEYCLCGEKLKTIFKTNTDIIDSFDKNNIRSERLKDILG